VRIRAIRIKKDGAPAVPVDLIEWRSKMALPPKGDPRRPLHLAIRSTRLLAIIFLLFGSCVFIPFLIGRTARGIAPFAVASALIYTGPGAAYLVFSIYMKRRKFWAVVCATVLASIQLLLTLIGGIFGIIAVWHGPLPLDATELIPMAILAFVILALSQLIYHLALSFEAIKHVPPDEQQRGFEPLMAQPIDVPTRMDESDGQSPA
jgi:hypothetical protein